MLSVGIICEYNPFHNGHAKQIALIREKFGQECRIVCLMSGNFVQRGAPAIIDKSLRAEAAVKSGADLVLELPVTYALSSAEGFAAGGVRILGSFCDWLCFGAETDDCNLIMSTAKALLSDEFSPLLRNELDKGLSFPAARQAALEKMGICSDFLERPNNILAVEYCKAILSQGCRMQPMPILREGDYHAQQSDRKNPSATSLRNILEEKSYVDQYVPAAMAQILRSAPLHTTAAGEKAILGKLRGMTDAEFEALPYGSEGLWRKLMHACREYAALEEILENVKSKRYTRTRLDRMVMCSLLGITEKMLLSPAPYTRVLAFSNQGREVLKQAKLHGSFLNAGEKSAESYWELEKMCGALYGLFRCEGIDPPNIEETRRIIYIP